MAGDGSASPSRRSRSSVVLIRSLGTVWSKYPKGETHMASARSGARTETWPATRLSQPPRARIRRATATRKAG